MNFPSLKPIKYSKNSRYEKATRRQKGHSLGPSNTTKGQSNRWPKVVFCKSRGAQPLYNRGTRSKAKKKERQKAPGTGTKPFYITLKTK